jgi:hypothetical protein
MVPKKIINIYMNDPGGPNQTECENAPHDTMYEWSYMVWFDKFTSNPSELIVIPGEMSSTWINWYN